MPHVEIGLRRLDTALLGARNRVPGNEPRVMRGRQLRAGCLEHAPFGTTDVGDDRLRRERRRDACEDIGRRSQAAD